MDLLKTAVTALREAVVTGREDGHHHQRQHHYEDHDSQSILASESKTADQVYNTLLQAVYTLGEVVGDFERRFGIGKDDDEGEEKGYEGRPRAERNGNRRGDEGADDWNGKDDTTAGSGYGYDYGGALPPPPDGYGYYLKDPYSPSRRRPYPPRRASSNPVPPHHHHNSRSQNKRSPSPSPSPSSSPSPSQSPSPPPSSSSSNSVKSKKGKKNEKKPKSKNQMIMHNLPGLITRAAFILELLELNEKHKEATGMAAKYAALAMGLKLVKQARREYKAMSERRGK